MTLCPPNYLLVGSMRVRSLWRVNVCAGAGMTMASWDKTPISPAAMCPCGQLRVDIAIMQNISFVDAGCFDMRCGSLNVGVGDAGCVAAVLVVPAQPHVGEEQAGGGLEVVGGGLVDAE